MVALETHQLELPGVSLQVTPRRHYLYGSLAAHLLGYVGEVTVKDLNRLPDYHMGDEIGKFGLERVGKVFCAATPAARKSRSTRSAGACECCKEIPKRPAKASS